jgi:hypothetical protein
VLSGRDGSGKPLRDPEHAHAFFLPEDHEQDGFIDHLVLYARAGLDQDICKHVAAVLYGIGARLDLSPELLFRLRGVDAAVKAAVKPALNASPRLPLVTPVTANAITAAHIGAVGPVHSSAVAATWMMAAAAIWRIAPQFFWKN